MGGSQSNPIPGGGTEGYHILKVQENSPGETAGLEAFFDFIVAIGNTRLDQDNEVLKTTLNNNVGKEIKLVVYSSKTQSVREVDVTPNNDWGGHGSLGVSIRFCSFDGAYENVWHILEVHPQSPAEQAGLRAFTDYIIGSDSVLHESEDLFSLIEAHEGRPLKLYVYNSEDDTCREVTIVPNSAWPGEGSLGCGIGYGYLHRIPIRNAVDKTERKRKTSNIPSPPLIKPATFQLPNAVPSNEPLTDPSIVKPVENPVNGTETNATQPTDLNPAPIPAPSPLQNVTPAYTSPVPIFSTANPTSIPSPSENSIPQNTSVPTYSLPGQPQIPVPAENTSNVQFYSVPATSQYPATSPATSQYPAPSPNMPFYPTSTFSSNYSPAAPAAPVTSYQMFNQYTPSTAPFVSSAPMSSTVTSSPSPAVFPGSIGPPPTSGYVSAHGNPLQGGYRVPGQPAGISSYFNREPVPVRSGNETVATMSGINPSFSQIAGNPSNGVQGVSVTTPISLPGMPPITVSATLPYSAIEGLHIDASKQATSSAAAV